MSIDLISKVLDDPPRFRLCSGQMLYSLPLSDPCVFDSMQFISSPPMLLEYRSSKVFVIITLCLAFFTDGFIYGLVVLVLPFSSPERHGVDLTEVQFWTSSMLTAFGLANLVGAPLLGWLADRSGGCIFASCMLALLPVLKHSTVGQIVLLCSLLTLHAFAFSLLITPLVADLASLVKQIPGQTPELREKTGPYCQDFSLLGCGISAGVMVGSSLAGLLYYDYDRGITNWTLEVLSALIPVPIVRPF